MSTPRSHISDAWNWTEVYVKRIAITVFEGILFSGNVSTDGENFVTAYK